MPEQRMPINVRFNSPAPKKSKVGLIILITAVALLLVGGIWVYFKYFKTKDIKNDATVIGTNDQRFSSRNNPNGPYYHSIYKVTSADGLNWVKNKSDQAIFDHASVPGAVIKDGIIYVYFVDASGTEDQLSVGLSRDNGQTFIKSMVDIKGVNKYDAVDPNPVLVDNIIYLYYLGDFTSKAKSENQTFTFYRAKSSDGINFDQAEKVYSENNAITDPDVFITDTDWRMLINKEQSLELAVSRDQGKTFILDPNFLWDQGGISSTIKISSDYYTYFCKNGISVATGAQNGELKFLQNVLSDQESPGNIICDPSVIKLDDGSFMMFYKMQKATTTSDNNEGQGQIHLNSSPE